MSSEQRMPMTEPASSGSAFWPSTSSSNAGTSRLSSDATRGAPALASAPGTAGQSRDDRSMKQATPPGQWVPPLPRRVGGKRSEEHTSELQSRLHLVCRLLLEKKKKKKNKKSKIPKTNKKKLH